MLAPHVVATLLMLVFLIIQLNTVSYGTSINNQIGARSLALNDSAEDQFIPSDMRLEFETSARWHQRFMLYSIEADEMLSIIALSRIHPPTLQFDPHYYQYGGAWLYPLGGWFAFLKAVDLISVAELSVMLEDSDRMDSIYIWGRVFVLLSFIGSAILLYATLLRLTNPGVAAMILGIYLFCPASLIMSQTMKPHWYGLLWVNSALYVLVRSFQEDSLRNFRQIALAAFLALAVGSALTFSLFAVFVWLALASYTFYKKSGYHRLFLIPGISIAFYVLLNPYIFLNMSDAIQEFDAASSWFQPAIGVAPVTGFIINSGLPGFGIFAFIIVCILSAWQIYKPINPIFRLAGFYILVSIFIAGTMQANLSDWHVNFRYIPYFITGAAMLLTALPVKICKHVVVVTFALTIGQGVPTMLAYTDENDPAHSTRLLAAGWVARHVPPGTAVCLNTSTPAPFNTPPFSLNDYRINDPECSLRVHVERIPDKQGSPEGWALVSRFSPRLSDPSFPLVIGHINPQISFYTRL